MLKHFRTGAVLTALSLITALSVNAGEKPPGALTQQSFSTVNASTLLKQLTVSDHVKSGGHVCGTDENGQQWQPSPNEKQFFEGSKISQQFGKLNMAVSPTAIGNADDGEYIVPVVFHIYGSEHNCSSGGICAPDSVIKDALRKSNEDFQGLNTQDGPIAAQFQAIRENMNVEFVLAQVDPSGNPTTGIVRHGAASGYGNYEAPNDAARAAKNAEIAADAWDNYRYMNIYIMNDLSGDGETNNSGVAWYPSTSMSDDGLARVVYNGAYLGTNTSENFRSVLTHEFGHWLNLPHTFDGNTCSSENEIFCSHSGDRVCDTPQMINSSMANNAENCLGDPTNTENFMHYTDNYAMFTQQQAQRMYAALHHPARASLWTDENLVSVGLSQYVAGSPHSWDGSGADAPPEGEVLMEIPGLAAEKGDIDTYTIELEAGTEVVAFYLDGYSEDPDLYVRHGQTPSFDGTNWTYDYQSFLAAGTPEFVGIVSPKTTGTYYVTVHAFSAYSNARLMAVKMDDPTLCVGCERVVLHEEDNLTAKKGDAPKNYAFTVPVDATRVMVEIPGGYGSTLEGGPDPDLYVSHNSVPTTEQSDCSPFKAPGLREVCEFTGSDLGGTYNVMIVPFLDYSDVSLRVVYDRPIPTGGENEAPTANANGPYSAELGNAILFSSAGSSDSDGSIASYSWNFGDGNTSTTASSSHTYANAGTYTVTLTVTDDGGKTATATVTAEVTEVPSNQLESGVPVTGVSAGAGEDVIYFIDIPANATNVVFNISGGSGDADLYTQFGSEPTDSSYACRPYVGGNEESCSQANPSEGRWYVRVKGYQTFADVTLTVTYDVAGPNVAPTANANGPYSGNANTAISFSSAGSSDSDGSIASYAWNFGDGATSTAANPSHTYSTAGTYNATLTVTDNAGASASATAAVTVGAAVPGGLVNACASESSTDYVNMESGKPYCVTSSTGNKVYFYFHTTSATRATLKTEHGSGDATLYYSNSTWPSTTQYTTRSNNSGNTESITTTDLGNGWNHIMIDGTHSGMTIQLDLE
ncbi:MAG: M43 family zinc metalloprotease [Endozoicomonas sp.]|uniref:M43 family zinc metalloprotease n=1 Tax=Endozoicomonas sp. TaxID=1892382 RepID=UPI003D9AEFD0